MHQLDLDEELRDRDFPDACYSVNLKNQNDPDIKSAG
jgi:hypothetical protein